MQKKDKNSSKERDEIRNRTDRLAYKTKEEWWQTERQKEKERSAEKEIVCDVCFFFSFLQKMSYVYVRARERERECFEDVVGDDLVSVVTVIALFTFGAGELRLSESPSFDLWEILSFCAGEARELREASR